MEWKTAIDTIKRSIDCRQYLQESKGGLYVCPFCHSGENGHNNTGALKYYPLTNTWACFACKSQGQDKYSGDVIDLFRKETGATVHDAVIELARQAGITEPIEFGQHYTTAADDFAEMEAPAKKSSFIGESIAPAAGTAAPQDFTRYYQRCRQNLLDSAEAQAYLQRRGISLETAQACCIGFDPQADPANAPGAMGNQNRPHPCPRIIIPTTPAHYVGRSIDPDTPDAFAKMNNKGGKPGIFQEELLFSDAENVFVCEGALDALSCLEVNRPAIALNSASNVDLLLQKLEAKPTKSTLIICLDKDKTGELATRKLKDGLRRLNISYTTADICGGHKDPNEALTADRAAFEAAVAKATAANAARPDNTAAYIDNLMAGEIDRFKQARDRKTGFENLDEKAGGLNAGLYVLAAISSLGKTTFALQMADQLAAQGQEVLFFSMEQSRLEMVSKSLARLTAQADMKTAVTSLSIRKGFLPSQVTAAARQYKERTGERLSIIEGNFNCDIGYIADYIRRYRQRTGAAPVVFIDYLQILQPAADGKTRSSKKDEVDLAITELKRLSRELDLTIIVISSINRANYMTEFSFESLKESGGIEFTADVVWGLQLACLDEELFEEEKKIKKKRKRINEAKAENPRKIKFISIKNRYGISSFDCNFAYYPQFDLFVPATAAEPAHAAAKRFPTGGKGK